MHVKVLVHPMATRGQAHKGPLNTNCWLALIGQLFAQFFLVILAKTLS